MRVKYIITIEAETEIDDLLLENIDEDDKDRIIIKYLYDKHGDMCNDYDYEIEINSFEL